MPKSSLHRVSALVVHQWLHEWDEVRFSKSARRQKPASDFYVFSMPSLWLRKLSNVYRRQANQPRSRDTRIQRVHDPERSAEIKRFIHGGFPWSDLSDRQKMSSDYIDLRMPGWLPTAIIANVLAPGTVREGLAIRDVDCIQVERGPDNTATLILPKNFDGGSWEPPVFPIEIIDGQHRLYAFEDDDLLEGDYELPVVAFYNLDITWQAYLFYTINIKPKRINTSLAFDLYPILRIQDWLEKSASEPNIYRETRSQELTEVLWSHPDSPWKGRISMLGERKEGAVTQAAFVRALTATYVRRWETWGKTSIGGLFGAELPHRESLDVLDWNRVQQAAFLILVWQCVRDAVAKCSQPWAISLREKPVQPKLGLEDDRAEPDPAFAGKYSLLATDQGIRGVLQVTNDMCFLAADQLRLSEWLWSEKVYEEIDNQEISRALRSLKEQPVRRFLQRLAAIISQFDWRTSSWPLLTDQERRAQMVFRASGGYKELRQQLVECLASSDDHVIQPVALDLKLRLDH